MTLNKYFWFCKLTLNKYVFGVFIRCFDRCIYRCLYSVFWFCKLTSTLNSASWINTFDSASWLQKNKCVLYSFNVRSETFYSFLLEHLFSGKKKAVSGGVCVSVCVCVCVCVCVWVSRSGCQHESLSLSCCSNNEVLNSSKLGIPWGPQRQLRLVLRLLLLWKLCLRLLVETYLSQGGKKTRVNICLQREILLMTRT